MGGGDLNLKKSWHPSTLRNIERVWKAEQKHEAEQKKIEQLQRELAEERAKEEMQNYAENQGVVKKKEEKLDWMYQGPAALVDREQYLTGRQIDKTFEILEQQEQGNLEPVSKNDCHIGSIFNQNLSAAPVDIANKIREDPLFMIRKQEEERQKKLLNNPIKLKQLQEMLRDSLSSGKDKKKKKKKHKKNSDSDDDSKISKRKHKKKYLEKKIHRKRHNREKQSSDSDSSDHGRYQKYTAMKYDRKDIRPSKQNDSYKSQHREMYKKKMSKEELEHKRQEMMENAVWREKQRHKNIQLYKEEEIKESAMSEKVKPKDFIKPMLSKAANVGTVENRIKQNIYNIQRCKGSMDTNFARR